MRWIWLPLVLIASVAAAAEGDEPLYRLPDGFEPPAETPFAAPEALTEKSLAALSGRGAVWDRRVARRTLAALGEAALPTMVARLRTADRRVRRDLVTAIGDMRTPAADGLLVAATRDASWGVREIAVTGLGLRGRSEAVPALLVRLEDPVWRVRAAVVDALRRLAQTAPDPDDDAIRAAVTSRLADRDREVRRRAAWAVFRLQHEPALLDAFQVLWNGPRLRRPRIVRELPRTDRPAIVEILGRIMSDSDEDLAFAAAERFAAIRGLEVLDQPGMRERLREALLRSTGKAALVVRRLRADALPFLIECLELRGRDVRRPLPGQEKERARHILDLMASLGAEQAIPFFRAIIEDEDEDDHLLQQAIDVGRLAFPRELEEAFEKRYRDKRSVVYRRQGLLLVSLARTNIDIAAPLLAEAAASGTMDLQLAVIDAIRAVGDRCDRPNLLREILRTSRNKRVLEKALPLAARVLGEEAEPLILPRLEDGDYRVRAAAVTALTSRKSETNAALLRDLFRAAAPEVNEGSETLGDDPVTLQRKETLRREILQALPLIAPEPDLEFLDEALDADEPLVRMCAADALGEAGDPKAAAVVLAALARESEETARTALLRALVKCDGDAATARIDAMLREGDREDRKQILKSLAAGDRPLPDAVRKGLVSEEWDANLRLLAASAIAEKGTEADLDLLVSVITAGAPPALEDEVLGSLGDREAAAQAPGLIALLPTDPLEDLDPGRHDFTLSLLESLGRLGNPVAAAPLRELLARTRLRADEDLARVEPFRLQALGLAAQALARVDPEGAMPDLLDLVLDPVIAKLHWDLGISWLSSRHRLHREIRGVCFGLQRVAAPKLAAAVQADLAARHRSGLLLELPPGYLSAVADQLAESKRKRPRKAAAAAIRAAMLRVPSGVTRHSYETARSLATWCVFRGTPEEIVTAAERARRDLILDPGIAKTAEQRRMDANLLRALILAGEGLQIEDTAERLKRFEAAADVDTGSTDIAWYLAWCGLTRGIDFEHVKTWTRRATALSASGESQRWIILDLQGVVHRRDKRLAQAEAYLERAYQASRMAKSAMAAYHRAEVLCELGRLRLARTVLLEALEKDDTYWASARANTVFRRLGDVDGVEQLIADAMETFD